MQSKSHVIQDRARYNSMIVHRNDKEFRSKLVATIPGIDPVLKVLFQEEGNVVSKATQSINNATQKAVDVKNSVGSFFGAGSPSTEEKTEAAKSMILEI